VGCALRRHRPTTFDTRCLRNMGTVVLDNWLGRRESEILPDLPLISIANKRQIDRSSTRQLHSSRSEAGQKCPSSKDWRSFGRELSIVVPKGRGERNSGALSLEPFEMSGLNFQVSVEYIGIGSAGEKKE